MDDLLRLAGLVLFGVAATWFLTEMLGTLLNKKGAAKWVWNQLTTIATVLILVGFGMAIAGFNMGGTSGSTLVVFGSLLSMAGMWMLLP